MLYCLRNNSDCFNTKLARETFFFVSSTKEEFKDQTSAKLTSSLSTQTNEMLTHTHKYTHNNTQNLNIVSYFYIKCAKIKIIYEHLKRYLIRCQYAAFLNK